MLEEKLLGSFLSYDPVTRIVSLRLDFIEPDTQKIIEDLVKEKKYTSVRFVKPHKREKTNPQLAYYYAILVHILQKAEVYPNAEAIKSFDTELKKLAFDCKKLEIFESEVPVPISKADMTVEMMSHLIQVVLEQYDAIIDDEFKHNGESN